MNIPDSVPPVEQDSRGILDPARFREAVHLARYPATGALEGVVDRFWAVRWALPDGCTHTQEVLTHPAANLSVGPADGQDASGPLEARLYGVQRGLTRRRLLGQGWTVAAMTTVGGLGALIDGPASAFTDHERPLGTALGVDGARLLADCAAAPDEPARVALLAAVLEEAVRPDRLAAARDTASVARVAETDRGISHVADLARRAGVSERTLQRQFGEYAGVSPTWVLRRYRLLDAAESVRDGTPVDWADLAARLGYADQAHLIRDFRAATGQTPDAYARAQRG